MSGLRSLAATLPLAVWCVLASTVLTPRRGVVIDAALLVGVIAAGGGIFWLASVALRSPERQALSRLLPGRRAR